MATKTVLPPPRTVAEPTAPDPRMDIEVGISSFLPYMTPYKSAWEALRDEEITVRQLVAMRKTDGQARALYRLLTLPVRAALKTATFVPVINAEGGEEEAEFVEQMFTLPAYAGGMHIPFDRVIAQMLMALFDGFSAFELVYTAPKTGPLANKWTLKKLAYRPSETITFLVDDHGDFAGFRQQTMFQGRTIDVPIPGEHAIYYAANEEEKRFYGLSYFQSAFFHWDKKYKLYVIAQIAAQRAAVGTRVGTVPPNANKVDKEEFGRALADLGVAQYIRVPEGYKVENLRESGGFDFLAHVNHHNSQMSKSVLAGFFDKEQGGGDSGKLVDFGTQSDSLFLTMLGTIMGEIEDVINNAVIPRFVDWNFGTDKYPRFQFGSLSEQQKKAMLDLFKQLAVAGEALTIRPELVHELEKQVAEEFGLELDWETIEERMEEERIQAEEMAAMEAEALAAGGTPGAAAPPPAVPASPLIDPSLLPSGFTLTNEDEPFNLNLTDEAAELLSEAAADLVELVRGKPRHGGPKHVRTAEGAKKYGEVIGSPITKDIAQRTAGDGVKGKPYARGVRSRTTGRNTSKKHNVFGGGPGAKAQNLGTVNMGDNQPAVVRTLTHPRQPGAQLLDYGDGTFAVRDAAGNISARQRFTVERFLRLGWKISHAKK